MQRKEKQNEKLPVIRKTHFRHYSNQENVSKLAARLFKNESLNRINPNLSMLASSQAEFNSQLNRSNSNNQLIASISLKKLRKSEDTDTLMKFSNGQILMGSNTLKKGLHGRKLFKKIDKIENSVANILPDDLIDFPIEKDEKEDGRRNVNKSILKQKSSHRENQDKDDLFPEDFMQLLEEDTNITNEFCYLQKMEHPYDLKIIEFDKNFEKKSEKEDIIYPDEYITISSRGVTYFGKEQSRFVPLEEWKKESMFFKKIVKLDFFKNYKIIKSFGNWKKYIRKSAMKSTIDKLNDKLVYNDRYLRESLLETRRLCWMMENDLSYCKLNDSQKVMNFKEFKYSQEVYIKEEFEKKINEVEEDVKETLIKNMSESMREFKEENKISSSVEGKGMPLLIGDEKNLQMPYTKEATLRTQQQKFQKFIKLIDMIVVHSKVNMMSDSTNLLSKKLDEENENYERQVVESNFKLSFKGKQYLECKMSFDHSLGELCVQPAQEDLETLFEDIINMSVVRLCRNHKKMSHDIDILSIVYDSQDQIPKQSEFDILKVIMTSDDRQEKMINLIMNSVNASYLHILSFAQRFSALAKVNFDNLEYIHKIENYSGKDHQQLKSLLEKWYREKETVSQISMDHEGPLFVLSLKDFKEETLKSINACILKAKQVIPKVFAQSMEELNQSLNLALSQMQREPIGIQTFVKFLEHKNAISLDIDLYSDQLMQICCLQMLQREVVASDSSASKMAEKTIKQIQQAMTTLRKKLQESDMNNKLYEKRAQDDVNQMIPRNRTMLAELYMKIESTKLSEKPSKQIKGFINKRIEELEIIQAQFYDIRSFQLHLNMCEEDATQLNQFIEYFRLYCKIWETKVDFEDYWEEIQETNWGSLKTEEVNQKLEEVITTMMDLSKQAKEAKQKDLPYQLTPQQIQATKEVLEKVEKVKPIIEVIYYLNDKTFGEKELKEIRLHLQQKNQTDLIKILECDKKQTKTNVLSQSAIASELPLLKNVVMKAKRHNDINQKFILVKDFGKPHTIAHKSFRNITQNFRANIKDLLDDLDEKIILINSIHEGLEQSQKYKTKTDRVMLYKLREILLLWDDYEKHIEYFEPIFNCTDWKTTKQGKTYYLTQQNWRKASKQLKDSQQLQKIASNDKILQTLKQNNEQLELLYSSTLAYFQNKRALCPRFYFLSNSQIIQLYTENKEKDFKGFSQFVNILFPTIKQLVFRAEDFVPHEAKNFEDDLIHLRFGRTSNFEIDQMVRALEESMKIAVKTSLKVCYTAFDIDDFNRVEWIAEHNLQALVFVSSVYFTKIIEQDYLGAENNEDFERFYSYTISQIQELRASLKEENIDELTAKKIQVLITLYCYFRDTINHLNSLQCTSIHDYNWIKQVRTYYSIEQTTTEYLSTPINYGNQFVSISSSPLINYFLTQKALLKIVNLITCNIVALSNQSLLEELSTFNAKPYQRVSLTISTDHLLLENFINGTWIIGSFTDFTLTEQISSSNIEVMANSLSLIYLAIQSKEPHLKGMKNLTVNRDVGICLIAPQVLFPQIEKKLKFQYRTVCVPQISWQCFLSAVFQIKNIEITGGESKLGKILTFIDISLGKKIITRKQIEKILSSPQFKGKGIEKKLYAKILKQFNKNYLSESEKSFINKVFRDSFSGVPIMERYKSMRSMKEINSSIQIDIQKINNEKNNWSIVVLLGRDRVMKDALAKQIFESISMNEFKSSVLIINDENLNVFFGKYEQNKWIPGLLTSFFKDPQHECMVLKGQCTKKISIILKKLASSEDNELILDNGQKFKLLKSQKIIFLSQSTFLDIPQSQNIYIIENQHFNPDDVLNYMTDMYIFGTQTSFSQKYFSEHWNCLKGFKNIYLNNMEKTSKSNLKLIGVKNQFLDQQLIMERFLRIVKAVLGNDHDQICTPNFKFMEKVFFWSLFWSIGSSLPKQNLDRLEKLFDSIKIQFDRSHPISETKLLISERNQSICKVVKTNKVVLSQNGSYVKINNEIQAKAEFLKMLSVERVPIFICGERGSGKSEFMNYFSNFLKEEHFYYLKVTCHKDLSLDDLLRKLEEYTFMKYESSDSEYQAKLMPKNGKKFILFLDDLNLLKTNSQIMDFIQTFTSEDYYFNKKTNKKIQIGDIWLICAENSNVEPLPHSFIARNFMPIEINAIQVKEILEVYDQKDISHISDLSLKDVLTKIANSISILHQFSCGLESSGKNEQGQHLTNETPIWIMSQMMRRCKEEKVSEIEAINLWKYLSIMKYVKSGLFVSASQEIEHELNNLIGLLTKNTEDSCQAAEQSKPLINKIISSFPYLQLYPEYEEILTYLLFNLGSTQHCHFLTNSLQLLPQHKASILKYLSSQLKINFLHVTNLLELNWKSNQQTIMYIDGQNQSILKAVFIYIIESQGRSKKTFIIDIKSAESFVQYLHEYPKLLNFTIFIEKSALSSTSPNYQLQNWDLIEGICEDQDKKQVSWQIYDKMKEIGPKVERLIESRTNSLQNGKQNFIQLNQEINGNKEAIVELKNTISLLSEEEEKILKEKNQLVNTLVQLKQKLEPTEKDEQEKEQANKKMAEVDIEIKRVKSIKNDKTELLNKTEQNLKMKEQILKLYDVYQKRYEKQCTFCSGFINFKKTEFIMALSILELCYKNSQTEKYDSYVKILNRCVINKIGIQLEELLSILLECPIKNVLDEETLIRWILNDYKIKICTKNYEETVEQLAKKVTRAKFVETQYQLSQELGKRPLFTKDQTFWGNQSVSILKPFSTFTNSQQQISEKQDCSKAIPDLSKEMQKILTFDKVCEKNHLQKDQQRVNNQLISVQLKIKSKIEKTKAFETKNQIADLKSLRDTQNVLLNKIESIKQKKESLNGQINEKFKPIFRHCEILKQFMFSIGQIFKYINLNSKQKIVNIFKGSIVYSQPPEQDKVKEQKEEGGQQGEEDQKQAEKEVQKEEFVEQVLIKQTNLKLSKNVLTWISLALLPENSIQAYFLLACYYKKEKGDINIEEICQIVSGKRKQIKSQFNQQLTKVLKKIICNEGDKLCAMLSLSEKQLCFNFREQFILGRQGWSQFLPNLLDQDQNGKSFVVVGHESLFCLKALEKQLKQEANSDNPTIFLHERDSLQSMQDNIEKTMQNQLIWAVLMDWKNAQNINSMISFLKNFTRHRLVLYYRSLKSWQEVRCETNAQNFHQVCLYDQEQNICFQNLQLTQKYLAKTDCPQISKLLKLNLFNIIARNFRKLSKGETQKGVIYDSLLLENLLIRSPHISINQVISFSLDFLDCINNRIYLREAKKLSKGTCNSELPDVFDDGSHPQIYSHLKETYSSLEAMMKNEEKMNQFFKSLQADKNINIHIDDLFGFGNYSTVKCELNQNEKISIRECQANLNQIISTMPIQNKLDDKTNRSGNVPFSVIKLHHENKRLKEEYQLISEKLTSLKKKLDSGKYLSKESYAMIKHYLCKGVDIEAYMLSLNDKIQAIKNILENKEEIKKCTILTLLRNPKQFLYIVLLENQTNLKKEIPYLEVFIRVLSEKEKQANKDIIQKGEILHLDHIVMTGVKQDLNRCTLENSHSNQVCKLSNLYIQFAKDEGHLRKIPILANGKQIGELSVASKLREPSILEEPLFCKVCQQN